MKRAIFGLLVATALSGSVAQAHAACYFGECTTTPAAPAASAQTQDQRPQAPTAWRVVAQDGSWSLRTNGKLVALVDEMTDGSWFALVKDGNTLSFLLKDPHWGLEDGTRLQGTVTFNGHGFRGPAVAMGDSMVAFVDVSEDAVRAFFGGGRAEIKVAGETWNMSLDGAGRVLERVADRSR